MLWFSRGTDFPPFYHPDEINKVMQVQTGDRNFNHPQLMLNSAAALYWLGGSPQSIVETGKLTRWVSVFFAAATAGILSYLAFLLAGPIAQLTCGWMLLVTPKLFELAHYLKEDPALAFGFAAVYLAIYLYNRDRSTTAATWLGVAAGLAISAKYIGVYISALGLIAMLILSWKQPCRWKHLGLFLVGLAIVAAIFNWQAIVRAGQFNQGLTGEIKLFDKEERTLINPRMFDLLADEFKWIAWVSLAIWLLSPIFRRRKLNAAEWVIIAGTFGYAAMLIFSSRGASRYLMPSIATLPLIISVALCWGGGWAVQRIGRPAWIGQGALCLILVILYTQEKIPPLQRLYTGFHNDVRAELVEFVRANIPPDAIIAQDEQVRLFTASSPRRFVDGRNLPNKIIEPQRERLGEEMTLDEIKAKGATYVIVMADRRAQGKLTDKGKNSLQGFLISLEESARPIWSKPAGSPAYLQPPFTVYDLSKPPEKSSN